MSLLVSADAKSSPGAVRVLGPGVRLLNRILGSKVRFQHLPVPFELYSDGIDLPVFEEFGAGTAALHLRINSSATSCSPTRSTAAGSASRSTGACSDRPCGTATSTTPGSSNAPTSR